MSYPRGLIEELETLESEGCTIITTSASDSVVWLAYWPNIQHITILQWSDGSDIFSNVFVSDESLPWLKLLVEKCLDGNNTDK